MGAYCSVLDHRPKEESPQAYSCPLRAGMNAASEGAPDSMTQQQAVGILAFPNGTPAAQEARDAYEYKRVLNPYLPSWDETQASKLAQAEPAVRITHVTPMRTPTEAVEALKQSLRIR
jgi:hypothetical protein